MISVHRTDMKIYFDEIRIKIFAKNNKKFVHVFNVAFLIIQSLIILNGNNK